MAKPKKSSASPGPNRKFILFGIVALVAVVLVIFTSRSRGGAATAPVTISLEPADLQRARGVAMGDDDAPVRLYEFADYQCPACGQFATFAHPLIKERLVDEGIVQLVRYDFPLAGFPHSFYASRAARCAEELGSFWEFHDVLYGRQPTWSQQRDPGAEFVDYAELVGLDRRAFQTCLRSDRHAEEVTRNLRLGEMLGVNSTPTLMINGERLVIRDYQDLEQRVLAAAGRSAPEAAPGSEAAPDAAPL